MASKDMQKELSVVFSDIKSVEGEGQEVPVSVNEAHFGPRSRRKTLGKP
jgi:hypothetical protein